MEQLYPFQIAVIVSSVIQVTCYALLAVRVRSWFNFASLPLLTSIGANGLLSFLGLSSLGPGGSFYAYAYCQATYAAVAIATVLPAFLPPPRLSALKFLERKSSYSASFPWFLLVLGIIVYMPVLITFRSELSDPRAIYEQTRTGYGQYYFLSTTLILLAWSSYLFVKRSYTSTVIFFGISAGMIYLHGSKGQIVSLATIYLLYRVYVLRKPVRLVQFVPLAFVGILLIGVSIILFSFNTVDASGLLDWGVGYSDYTRNAELVIDNSSMSNQPTVGRLTLEDEIYARVPRVLFPSKPIDFGAAGLAKIYFPANFDNQAGLPAFGIGLQYNDFSYLALPVLFFANLIIAWFTMGVLNKSGTGMTPGYFILVAFLSGIVLIPLGIGYLLPESIVLGLMVNFLFRVWPGVVRFIVLDPNRRLRRSSVPQK